MTIGERLQQLVTDFDRLKGESVSVSRLLELVEEILTREQCWVAARANITVGIRDSRWVSDEDSYWLCWGPIPAQEGLTPIWRLFIEFRKGGETGYCLLEEDRHQKFPLLMVCAATALPELLRLLNDATNRLHESLGRLKPWREQLESLLVDRPSSS